MKRDPSEYADRSVADVVAELTSTPAQDNEYVEIACEVLGFGVRKRPAAVFFCAWQIYYGVRGSEARRMTLEAICRQ